MQGIYHIKVTSFLTYKQCFRHKKLVQKQKKNAQKNMGVPAEKAGVFSAQSVIASFLAMTGFSLQSLTQVERIIRNDDIFPLKLQPIQ